MTELVLLSVTVPDLVQGRMNSFNSSRSVRGIQHILETSIAD
jgi:hypothetical protein